MVVVPPRSPFHLIADMSLSDLLPPVSSAFFFFFSPPPRVYKITLETLFAKPTGSVRKAKEATSTRPNSHSSSPGGGRRRGAIMFMAARVQFDCLGEYELLVSGRQAGRRV